MPAPNPNLFPSLLGTWVSGDFGGLTIYTTKKGKKVFYQEAPALEPPTPAQTNQRNRFRTAQAEWKNQTHQVKKNLENMCIRASLVMTGQNLWIRVAMRHEQSAYETLQHQTGITAPAPTPV